MSANRGNGMRGMLIAIHCDFSLFPSATCVLGKLNPALIKMAVRLATAVLSLVNYTRKFFDERAKSNAKLLMNKGS